MPRTPRPQGRGTSSAGDGEPAVRLARRLPGVQGVRVHRRDGVDVLFVSGPPDRAGGQLDLAVPLCLSDEPRAVVCDLTDVEGPPDEPLLGCLGALAALVRSWPAIPLALVAGTAVRARIERSAHCAGLIVQPSLHEALALATRQAPPDSASRQLAPHPTAARAARDFLTEQLLEWRLPRAVPAGSLVMSELVTNAMIYAQTAIDVALARHHSLVRIAVRDEGRGLPEPRSSAPDRTGGRGLILVDGFARAWGVLPSPRRGKVVWAVVDG